MGFRPLLSIILLLFAGCYQASLPPRDVAASASPIHPRSENLTIRRPQYIFGKDGEITAIKSGRRLFQLKPEFTDNIDPLMKASEELGVSAIQRTADSVYIVLSVTIDHKTFLVR